MAQDVTELDAAHIAAIVSGSAGSERDQIKMICARVRSDLATTHLPTIATASILESFRKDLQRALAAYAA